MSKNDRPERNDLCWCGSRKKYKNCHMRQDNNALIARREAQFEQAAFKNGTQFGIKAQAAYDAIIARQWKLYMSLNNIAQTCHTVDLMSATQRANVLRILFSTHPGKDRADQALLALSGELDSVVKDYGPFVHKLAPGAIDHEKISYLLRFAGDVCDGLQALLREIDPDDGELLRQAIAKHNPMSDAMNRALSQKIGAAIPRPGPKAKEEDKKIRNAVLDEIRSREDQTGLDRQAILQAWVEELDNKGHDRTTLENAIYDKLTDSDDYYTLVNQWFARYG